MAGAGAIKAGAGATAGWLSSTGAPGGAGFSQSAAWYSRATWVSKSQSAHGWQAQCPRPPGPLALPPARLPAASKAMRMTGHCLHRSMFSLPA